MFQRTVQGCWLPTPFTSFPFTSPTVRHRVPSGSERAIAFFKISIQIPRKWMQSFSTVVEIKHFDFLLYSFPRKFFLSPLFVPIFFLFAYPFYHAYSFQSSAVRNPHEMRTILSFPCFIFHV